MLTERASGVLLHLSSLPSRGGIGDLGPAAYAFADFLAAAETTILAGVAAQPHRLWQFSLLRPVRVRGNPLFISVEKLVEDGWLPGDRLGCLPSPEGRADFEQARPARVRCWSRPL